MKESEPIGIPDSMQFLVESLIDICIIKGLFTDAELQMSIDKCGAVLNGLIDILIIKEKVTEHELEVARHEYHKFVQASSGLSIPPGVLFDRRRQAIRDTLELERRAAEMK